MIKDKQCNCFSASEITRARAKTMSLQKCRRQKCIIQVSSIHGHMQKKFDHFKKFKFFEVNQLQSTLSESFRIIKIILIKGCNFWRLSLPVFSTLSLIMNKDIFKVDDCFKWLIKHFTTIHPPRGHTTLHLQYRKNRFFFQTIFQTILSIRLNKYQSNICI